MDTEMNSSNHAHFLDLSMIHDAACQIADGKPLNSIPTNVLNALSERLLAELDSRSREAEVDEFQEGLPF